jgi:hypothetical protein
MSRVARGLAAAVFAGALSLSAVARAQDGSQGPDPEEVKKKVLEIERLMKSAEEALARSTDVRTAEERAAEAAKKILDDKSKKETGKSSAELRKEAEGGSKEAKETLERLTNSANEEAKKAAEKMTQIFNGGSGSSGASGGIKELIEKIKGDGAGASEGIRWLLKNVRESESQSKGGGGGGSPKDEPPKEKKPEEKKQDEPQKTDKKPESKTEPPHSPEFEQWIAELPPQVRKAYDTQDWDSIPPKWRDMIRAWAAKLSKEDAKDKR